MRDVKYVICDRCHKGVEKEECEVVSKGRAVRYYCRRCLGKMINMERRIREWEQEHELNTIH